MLKFKNALFILAITILFSGCAAKRLYPPASNNLEAADINFYPEDTMTSHNFGPGY